MAHKVFNNSKELNNTTKVGSEQLKSTTKSPFYNENELNRIAKGMVTKSTELACYSVESIKKVGAAVKELHTDKRKLYNVDVLKKDNFKRFCNDFVTTVEIDPIFDNCTTFFNSKGEECQIINGKKHIYKPISGTLLGYFNAFARVVRVELVATEKATKRAQSEAKKAKKASAAAAKKRNELFVRFNSGKIGFAEYMHELEKMENGTK